MSQPASTRYDTVSLVFHWITAIVVAVAFVLGPEHFGRMMRQGVDPATRADIVWHETLGLLVLALTVLRLVWVALRPAAPRFDMPPMMELTAKAVRLGMWLLLLILPLSALMALGSEGHPLTVLGGVRVNELPMFANSPLAKLADWGDVHGFLGDAIMAIAGLHAAAAIYHHVWMKDGVLKSMSLRG